VGQYHCIVSLILVALKPLVMKKLMMTLGIIAALGFVEQAQAQVRVNVNLGIGAPVYYPAPRPVVVYDEYPVCTPRSVVVEPARPRYVYYDVDARDRYYICYIHHPIIDGIIRMNGCWPASGSQKINILIQIILHQM
jgi:hypothetical protein